MIKSDTLKSLIYTYKDWDSIRRSSPLYRVFRNDKSVLYYIGSNHSRDINNEQYKQIDAQWNLFLNEDIKDRVVMIEGGLRNLSITKEDAVKTAGEAGYITFLAHKSSIPVISPEPSKEDQAKHLVSKYGPENALLFYAVRQLTQWHRMLDPKEDYKIYIEKSLTKYVPICGLDSSYTSWDKFQELYTNTVGKDFDPNDSTFTKNLINPLREDWLLSEIDRESMYYRDCGIVEEIYRYVINNTSIFIVFGGTHLLLQERAIECIFAEL